uniref:Matrin 3-like 1.1 n=1 Tax=Oryzias sinensis TaxID=183150 RepID=A0A8C7WMQ8_9TELE
MSQSDGSQKQFSVGRGLLAAAETLNFNMNEQRSGRPMGGMSSGVGMSGVEHPDGSPQMPRRGGGNNLGSTMKLFASLGLSPSDLDALAEIPEDEISVETLPRILMQLKSRKGEAGERRAVSSMSSEAAFQGGRDSWEEGRMGRMGGPSMGEGPARSKPSADFGYSSMQNMPTGRGLGSSFNSGGGGRGDRPYPELSHQTSYGGLDMGPSQSDSIFMQRRIGSPSVGKVQDFLGVMPSMFPHVCSLCDFDVHSTMVSTSSPLPLLFSDVKSHGSKVVFFSNLPREEEKKRELLTIAGRFGTVDKHLFLTDQAFVQLGTVEDAEMLVKYYSVNPLTIRGRLIRLNIYSEKETVVKDVKTDEEQECGSSRVVYIGQIPNNKFTDEEILELAQPYGKVQKYFLNRIKREVLKQTAGTKCTSFTDSSNTGKLFSDLCQAAAALGSSSSPLSLGSHRCAAKRTSSPPPKSSEELPAKKAREEEEEEKEEETKEEETKEEKNGVVEKEEVGQKEAANEEAQSSDVGDSKTEENCENPLEDLKKIDEEVSLHLRRLCRCPPMTQRPPSVRMCLLGCCSRRILVFTMFCLCPGVEHVKMGYYCRICFLFYTNENTAKKTHCSSQAHYDKLQKYLEKEQTKGEKAKKTSG